MIRIECIVFPIESLNHRFQCERKEIMNYRKLQRGDNLLPHFVGDFVNYEIYYKN